MRGMDIQLALEIPAAQQRGGLKRHFPAHQDCHNTSSFQSTLSLSQQIFKPIEGKRKMMRPWDPSLDCLLPHHWQAGVSERPTSGDGCGSFSRFQTQKGAALQKTGNPLVTLWLLVCLGSHSRTPCQALDWNKGWIYLLQCKYLHVLSHWKLISSHHQFPVQLPSVGQGDCHPAQLRWENRESSHPCPPGKSEPRMEGWEIEILEFHRKKATQTISKSCRY